MIQTEQILNYFPPYLRDNPARRKYLLKEYIQLLVLDYLATTPYIRKLIFIGGTYLRLVKGIDRFSEDIDFDCKNLSSDEFMTMTDGIILFLRRYGLKAEVKDKSSSTLTAFRRNIHIPGLLFDLGLSGYKEERFLIKVESEDQQIIYTPRMANIKGCGFFFSFPVPADKILCAMKISALLSRSKGRDFYDTMFLLGHTTPDYSFLSAKCGIANPTELKSAFLSLLAKVNLAQKVRDFEHLLFEKRNSTRVFSFKQLVDGM
jgi:predicted nucleotidyltransferase component of viral defense system